MSGNSILLGSLGLIGVAVLASGFQPQRAPVADHVRVPAPTASTEPAMAGQRAAEPGIAKVELQRAADSHFYVDALVNGTQVRFLVDTGATKVVLTRADARRAGLAGGDYSALGETAGGRVRLMPVRIARLGLGPLSADQVPAMVAEDGLPISLLGQSYLARLGSVSIEGDRMILR